MKLLRGAISLTLLLFCLFCWPSSVSASSRRRYNRRRRRKYVPPACGAGQRRNYHSATHPGQWYDCTNCVAGRYMPSGTEQLGGYISNIGGGGTSCPSCHQYSCPGICSRGTISAAGATECTSCSAGKTTSTIGATGCSDCSAGKFTSQVGPHENGCVSESQTTMFFFCTNIHKYNIYIYIILYIYTHHSSTFLFSLFSLTLRTCTLGKRQTPLSRKIALKASIHQIAVKQVVKIVIHLSHLGGTKMIRDRSHANNVRQDRVLLITTTPIPHRIRIQQHPVPLV